MQCHRLPRIVGALLKDGNAQWYGRLGKAVSLDERERVDNCAQNASYRPDKFSTEEVL